ncbi:MAG: hypothetical protein R2713_07890 [Ilumatobacteraceae bacterium]
MPGEQEGARVSVEPEARPDLGHEEHRAQLWVDLCPVGIIVDSVSGRRAGLVGRRRERFGGWSPGEPCCDA